MNDDILDILVAHGVPGAVIVQVAKLIADAQQTQERRTKNTERMRTVRTHAHTSVHTETRGIPPSLLTDLTSSESKEEERLSLVALGREFATFWQQCPHKVGKRAAEKSFRAARKRATFEIITAGLARYAAKTDDRPWCNPATWLNQDRWDDREGPSQEGNGKPGIAQAAIDKRKRELMQRLQAQGASPYEIEEAIRRDTGLGQEGSGNTAQLRPTLGVVRGEDQGMAGRLAFPKH